MSSSRRLILATVAIVLLGCTIVVLMLSDRSADRSFRQFAVEVDTAKVTSVTITWPGNDTTLTLNRKNDSWVVIVATGDMGAKEQNVGELLSCLSGIEAMRQMARGEQSWAKYGVSDGYGTHVVVCGKSGSMADFYCGKVEIDQQRGRVLTYVRNTAESSVYMTDGYLNMILNRPFSSWIMEY